MSQPCYNMYIYNRNGICLNYTEWSRGKPTANMADEQKTMFGLLFTLKTFASAMDPTTCALSPLPCTQSPGAAQPLRAPLRASLARSEATGRGAVAWREPRARALQWRVVS